MVNPVRAWWYGKQESGNFGDILNPHILNAISGRPAANVGRHGEGKILAIGSILRWMQKGDHVWGAGTLSPEFLPDRCPEGVIVHAVRGPLSRSALQAIGAEVPEVYGDPGLLVARLLKVPECVQEHEIGIVLHYADAKRVARSSVPGLFHWIDIRAGVGKVIAETKKCKRVLSSCLHGIILAEALGLPARWIQIDGGRHLEGGRFKFDDYYLSTDRRIDPIQIASSSPAFPPRRFGWREPVLPDLDALIAAFPRDTP